MASAIFAPTKYSHSQHKSESMCWRGKRMPPNIYTHDTCHVPNMRCVCARLYLFFSSGRCVYIFVCPSRGNGTVYVCMCVCVRSSMRLCAFFLYYFSAKNFVRIERRCKFFCHASAVHRSTHSHHRNTVSQKSDIRVFFFGAFSTWTLFTCTDRYTHVLRDRFQYGKKARLAVVCCVRGLYMFLFSHSYCRLHPENMIMCADWKSTSHCNAYTTVTRRAKNRNRTGI